MPPTHLAGLVWLLIRWSSAGLCVAFDQLTFVEVGEDHHREGFGGRVGPQGLQPAKAVQPWQPDTALGMATEG
jgi:hypothetical protein